MLMAVVAAACSKSSSTATSSSTTLPPKQGGDIVVAAEQETACMDWIDANCGGSAWGVYTVQTNVMPRAYDYTDSGYKASNLLTGEATLVTTPQQVVTYHINPKAVWSDGQPIISHDFKYTWDQVAHGKNIYDPTGYSNISAVDDSSPSTVVVTFSTPFPDWKQLFGAAYGVFPSHLLEGKDRDALMKDGFSWSGGPWELAPNGWVKGSTIKLVPNPTYWGQKPFLNSVTFQLITDTAAEAQAFKSGQVVADYPQAQPELAALKNEPNTFFDAVTGLSYEGIWFQATSPPLDSVAVRQALAYSTDRNAIVSQLFAAIQPDIKPIDSFFTPAYPAGYSTAWAKYKPDMNMVNTLMTGDGWTKGSDGIWAKAGKKAAVELKYTTGNKRRQLISQILQSEWQAAGFQLTVTPEKSSVLFSTDLPAGTFQVALYAQTPSDDDIGQCNLWCSKNIPGPSNGGNGTNYDRVTDPQVDQLWGDADSQVDVTKRLADATQGDARLADLMPALPLDPFPDIVIIHTDKLGVQGGKFLHNFAYGPYTYMNTWFLK